MSTATASSNGEVRSTPGALILAGAMLVSMPLVAIQGPGHMTPMDAVNALFVMFAWVFIFIRRERVVFPLALPFWVIMVASFISLFAATDLGRSLSVIAIDIYLYLWFVTLTHFLSRHCDVGRVGLLWTGVSCGVALLTVADEHFGVLGGLFAGTRRATGTFENPNMFGDYLVVSFFVAWATAAGRRPLVYLALPLLFVGIRATASNGALVALLGGCCMWYASTSGFWTRRTLGILAVVGALGLAVVGVYRDEIETAVVDQLSAARGEVGGAALKGASERLPIWENIFSQVLESPIGVGPGNFAIVNAETTGDFHGAHNEYLGQLGERGFLGLAGWFALMAGVFTMMLRIREGAAAGFEPLGVQALFGLCGAMAAHAMVIELSHFRHFWMVLTLLAAVAAQVPRVAASPLAPAAVDEAVELPLAAAPARRAS